jgi:thiosulfate/3-mercaptopyruvate sulfurtransferase
MHMTFETLVDAATVEAHLNDPTWVVVDCRFSLGDTERGRRDYLAAHVRGAHYAHLDDDLSGQVVPGGTGRHPLPDVQAFGQKIYGWGITHDTQVVVYDDMKGAIAVRLWWLLGWLGHDRVAVMDGGWPVWSADERPVSSGTEPAGQGAFEPQPRGGWIATPADVARAGSATSSVLIDARAVERFRGDVEPIDAIAGHIPGAVSMPWGGNVGEDGRMLSADRLRARFEAVVGQGTEDVICYCGSGVTANHDILAMVHAGWPRPRLYPGSWSEWITDPQRETATGP